MNEIWALGLLLVLASTVGCLKLQRLCEKDHFEFDSVKVNAVFLSDHKIQLNTANDFLLGLYDRCTKSSTDDASPVVKDPKEFYELKEN